MYEGYFHLTGRPFDLAPDPRFLYLTAQHGRAAANVRFALMNHDSFVVITGEIGTGKTTILNAALDELGPQYVAARLVHTTLTDVELLQALLSEFGIPNYGTRKVRLLDTLRTYFLEQHAAGKHVVIIVDEAQHLSSAALEELRLLSCIDAHDRRIVSIVLTGQPSLDDVLNVPGLAQLRQRTRLRQRLRPMTETETAEYIRHRLKVVGGNADDLFDPQAVAEIHRLCLGIPRLINTLCDTALTACMVSGEFRVTVETLAQVVEELGWRWFEPDEGHPARGKVQIDAHLRAGGVVVGDQAGDARALVFGRQRDAQHALRSDPLVLRQGGDRLVLLGQTLRVLQHLLAERGQGEAPGRALHQALAEAFFQQRQAPRQGGLGQAGALTNGLVGEGDAAVFKSAQQA